MNEHLKITIQIFSIFSLLAFLAGPRIMQAVQEREITNETATEIVAEAPHDPYQEITISGKSAFVWDIKEHKKLYGKTEYEKLPLASVTKVMMALVATEKYNADQTVTVRAADLLEEGDHGLLVGEKWKLSDLIGLTLVSSSNDGASAIAAVGMSGNSKGAEEDKREFVEDMNRKARSIGLLDTTFANESGLDLESYQGGAYGTARDMAILYEYIWRKHPQLFEATTKGTYSATSLSGQLHTVSNTNDIVDNIPGIIGSKTGYTDLAGGNLVIITDIGIDHPVVIAVLGSTRSERFSDVEKLLRATTELITDSN